MGAVVYIVGMNENKPLSLNEVFGKRLGSCFTLGSYPQTEANDPELLETLQGLEPDSKGYVHHEGDAFLKQGDRYYKVEPIEWLLTGEEEDRVGAVTKKCLFRSALDERGRVDFEHSSLRERLEKEKADFGLPKETTLLIPNETTLGHLAPSDLPADYTDFALAQDRQESRFAAYWLNGTTLYPTDSLLEAKAPNIQCKTVYIAEDSLKGVKSSTDLTDYPNYVRLYAIFPKAK